MKVVIEDKKYLLYWTYNSKELSIELDHYGIVGELPLKKQLDKLAELGVKGVNPSDYECDTTHCVLASIEGKEIARASVSRHYTDIENRDTARKYSMAKMLKTAYPGDEFKPFRRAFWKAYHNRIPKKPEKKDEGAIVVPMTTAE